MQLSSLFVVAAAIVSGSQAGHVIPRQDDKYIPFKPSEADNCPSGATAFTITGTDGDCGFFFGDFASSFYFAREDGEGTEGCSRKSSTPPPPLPQETGKVNVLDANSYLSLWLHGS